jgi:hypothetical protein
MLRIGDCVQERWGGLESMGKVLSLQASISFGECVQYCEVDFNGKRRWILSLNLVQTGDSQTSEDDRQYR